MARRNPALALAAGFGEGYLGEKDRARQRAKDDEDRQMRREEYEARKAERERQERDRAALADAVRPASVTEAGALPDGLQYASNEDAVAGTTMPAVPRYRVETGAGAQRFDTAQQAQAAAAANDTPEAQRQRVMASGADPTKAITLANTLRQGQQADEKMKQERAAYAKKLKDEGAFEVGRAMETGDPRAVFDTMNAHGQTKLKDVPAVREVEIDVPGIGKRKAFEYSGTVVDPDGTERPYTHNSFKFNLDLVPFEKQLEFQRKGGDSDARQQLWVQQAEGVIKRLEMQGQVNEARAAAAAVKAQQTGQGVSREERLRYTSLFTDAGRRMQDSQRALNTMRSDRGFMRRASEKPDSPEGQQLAEVQSQLRSHTEERELYRSLLAGGGKEPALSDVPPKVPAPGGSTKVPPATQAARDSDRVQILNEELAKAKQRLAAGDPRAQADVDALNRELAAAQPRLASARGPASSPGGSRDQAAAKAAVKAAPKADYSTLWR